MRFFVSGRQERPTNSGPYPFVVLQTDNWDDYHFRTLFHPVVYLSESEAVDLRSVKILKLGQESGRTPIDEVFDELDGSYCSLGQELSYYESLRALPEDVRDEYLTALRDAAAAPPIRERFQAEVGFRTSLLRNGSAERALEDGPALLRGEDAGALASPGEDAESAEDSDNLGGTGAERLLRDAVDLVSATASNDVKIRAIQQARGVLVEWTDYDDERRLFAAVIDAGLLELEAFVRDERPTQSPDTILTNLRLNIDQAIDWANENRYVRFAATLMAILPLLAKFVA